MKQQKRTTVIIFLLLISLVLTCFAPLVSAQGGNGNQYMGGQGNSSGTQQQGPPDTTTDTGGFGGKQGGGYNQNDSGQQGGYHQNSSDGHQYRYRYQRRYTIMDGASNYTRIRSQCQENTSKEAFEIFFTIDTAPTLQLSYIPTVNATSGQRQFSLIVEQLVEYHDKNSNGKYDQNEDILSSLNMSNITFTNITYTNSTASDGKTVTRIETHTPDSIFSIDIYFVNERTLYLNSTLTSKEIKIDFKITNYPFMNQTSQLALITQVKTPFMINPEQTTYDEQQGFAAQESGLNISSANHSSFFTWANEVIVDNTSYPVNVTVLSETQQTFMGNTEEISTSTQVIFSYPHGKSIIHDPKIGIADLLQSLVPSAMQLEYLSVIYVVACLVSGIIFYGVIRYRKTQ
jgi:hypothetical protein